IWNSGKHQEQRVIYPLSGKPEIAYDRTHDRGLMIEPGSGEIHILHLHNIETVVSEQPESTSPVASNQLNKGAPGNWVHQQKIESLFASDQPLEFADLGTGEAVVLIKEIFRLCADAARLR